MHLLANTLIYSNDIHYVIIIIFDIRIDANIILSVQYLICNKIRTILQNQAICNVFVKWNLFRVIELY